MCVCALQSGMEKRLHVAVPMAALVQGEDALVAARHPPTAGYHAFNLSLVGDVRGRDCVIVDDLLDTADMLTESVRVLKNAGARKCVHAWTVWMWVRCANQALVSVCVCVSRRIVLYATHNLLTKDGIKIIQACEGLTEVRVASASSRTVPCHACCCSATAGGGHQHDPTGQQAGQRVVLQDLPDFHCTAPRRGGPARD